MKTIELETSVGPSDFQVIDALRAQWEASGERVSILNSRFAYLPEREFMVCAFDDAKDIRAVRDQLVNLRKDGVNVLVLLPLKQLSAAHDTLWGTDVRLRAWKALPGDMFDFYAEEIA